MCWIIGCMNDEEIMKARNAGYEMVPLTRARERQIFPDGEREPDDGDIMCMSYVDCDVVDVLDLPVNRGDVTATGTASTGEQTDKDGGGSKEPPVFYLASRNVASENGTFHVILGLMDSVIKAKDLCDEDGKRISEESLRRVGAVVHHQIIPLEVNKCSSSSETAI